MRLRRLWMPVIASVLPAGLLLWGVTVPGGYYTVLIWALVLWALVIAGWGVTVFAYRRSPVLLGVPLILAASWTVSSTSLPGRVVFAQQQRHLEQLQPSVYSLDVVYQAHGCTFYPVHDPGMATASGFAWCPGTVPSNQWDAEVFEPFHGDWYVYLLRHELYRNRFNGARPWGLQLTELQSHTDA